MVVTRSSDPFPTALPWGSEMMNFSLSQKWGILALLVVTAVGATVMNEFEADRSDRRTVLAYGSYSAEPLLAPDQLICVLRQIWKPEFVDRGDLYVQVNERKCFGNGEGKAELDAVVNLRRDPATGHTTGKIWFNDTNSEAYVGFDAKVYIQAVVTASPTSAEPFGRFVVDVVEEVTDLQALNPPQLASKMRIEATGNAFKFSGYSDIHLVNPNLFATYLNRATGQAVYRQDWPSQQSSSTVALAYDSNHICFQTIPAQPQADCFDRQAPGIPTVHYYGLYDTNGNRYLGQTLSPLLVSVQGPNNAPLGTYDYYPYGMGGSLQGQSPGNPPPSFESDLLVVVTDPSQPSSQTLRMQWLTRRIDHLPMLSPPAGAPTPMLDGTQLDNPLLLVDLRSTIGVMPVGVIGVKPLSARGGVLLN